MVLRTCVLFYCCQEGLNLFFQVFLSISIILTALWGSTQSHHKCTVHYTAEIALFELYPTGFPGGVHREGEHTLDVSADLTELGRSSTLVVCSGVKSILDIGKTLEYLV